MGIFKKKQLYLPALLILSVVILLLVWISFSTYQNFNRDREQTLEFVYRQGVAIIHTLESGAKTGLMLPGWSRRSMTALIEETGRNKDIAYIYLYDENGRVLYHSLPFTIWPSISPLFQMMKLLLMPLCCRKRIPVGLNSVQRQW